MYIYVYVIYTTYIGPNIRYPTTLLRHLAEASGRCCPMGVFDVEDVPQGKRAVVVNERNCSTCRECLESFNGQALNRGEVFFWNLLKFGLFVDGAIIWFFGRFPKKDALLHMISWKAPFIRARKVAGERRDAWEGQEPLHLFHRERGADPSPDGPGFAIFALEVADFWEL